MTFAIIAMQLMAMQVGNAAALTLQRLAELFGVHPRTIERWLREEHFPACIEHRPGTRRFWEPTAVLAWVQAREKIELTTCNITAVCEMTHRSRTGWLSLVKASRAPAPIARELGSGKDLWLIQDVKDWLLRTSGGYAPPGKSTPPVLRDGRRGPKRVLGEFARRDS